MVNSLSYFSFQPVFHDWCNKGMMHIKEPLLLIAKSSPYGGSMFPLSWCDGSSHRSLMVDRLSYFSFHPVLHNWCNKGCGMCYPVCGIVHIKEPLMLIRKERPMLWWQQVSSHYLSGPLPCPPPPPPGHTLTVVGHLLFRDPIFNVFILILQTHSRQLQGDIYAGGWDGSVRGRPPQPDEPEGRGYGRLHHHRELVAEGCEGGREVRENQQSPAEAGEIHRYVGSILHWGSVELVLIPDSDL